MGVRKLGDFEFPSAKCVVFRKCGSGGCLGEREKQRHQGCSDPSHSSDVRLSFVNFLVSMLEMAFEVDNPSNFVRISVELIFKTSAQAS